MSYKDKLYQAWQKFEKNESWTECTQCKESLYTQFAYYQDGMFFHAECVKAKAQNDMQFLFGNNAEKSMKTLGDEE